MKRRVAVVSLLARGGAGAALARVLGAPLLARRGSRLPEDPRVVRT